MLGSPNILDAIRRAGYLAYDDGIFSKHRGIYVDLDFHTLLGPIASIRPAKVRQLKSEDQSSVDRYVEAFQAYAKAHNLWQRVNDLAVVASSLPLHRCKDNFDALNRDITRAMLHSEKSAKRPAGKYAWSPKLREAGLLARYRHLRLREVQKGYCLSTPISALKTRLKNLQVQLDDNQTSAVEAITIRWKAALKDFREVRASSFDHRAVHLKTTLTHYENQASSSEIKEKIKRIKRLINIDYMRNPFRQVNVRSHSRSWEWDMEKFCTLRSQGCKGGSAFFFEGRHDSS